MWFFLSFLPSFSLQSSEFIDFLISFWQATADKELGAFVRLIRVSCYMGVVAYQHSLGTGTMLSSAAPRWVLSAHPQQWCELWALVGQRDQSAVWGCWHLRLKMAWNSGDLVSSLVAFKAQQRYCSGFAVYVCKAAHAYRPKSRSELPLLAFLANL